MRGLLAAACVAIGFAGAGIAQEAPVPAASFLTIKQDELLLRTRYGRAIQARIEAATKQFQQQESRIAADLEAEERSLTARRANLKPDEFRVLADAFDEKVEAIRAAQSTKARAVAQTADVARRQFLADVVPVLAGLMADRGAVAIVEKSAVFLAFDSIDITEAAIALIDERLGDGPVVPPASP